MVDHGSLYQRFAGRNRCAGRRKPRSTSEAFLEFTNFGSCQYLGCSNGATEKVKDFRDPERPVIKNMCQRHADLFLREQHEGGLHREKVQNCPLCRPSR